MFNYQQKIAGLLLHISSLPSGSMGEDAYRFIDLLKGCGCQVWQTLPVNMTHGDKSPYQCLSAHAGNPEFISLAELQQQTWLQQTLPEQRAAALSMAFHEFNAHANDAEKHALSEFCQRHAYWLDDFALFLSLREHYVQQPWNTWPQEIKLRVPHALDTARKALHEAINFHQFVQFLFFSQWQQLKQYAHLRGIQLFGDIPIFVSYDSADVWAQPQQFKLDDQLNMTVVAGVPPDYFSATGQRWGNPHYNWPAMQEQHFSWWIQRMQTQSVLFDILRIDHFRGLQAAWEIPAQEATAINGSWQEAPGAALLQAIQQSMPALKLIAEDLGIITPEVEALKQSFGLPGMKILQFAFDGSANNPYLPAHIMAEDVVYTGTHDNDTSLGWYQSLTVEQQQIVLNYLIAHDWKQDGDTCQMPEDLMRLALASSAFLAIIPMQDLLRLDGHHRMNVPGTVEGNWQWKFDWSQVNEQYCRDLQTQLQQYGRLH
jgi:4-alpha-glucanotransferase